MTQDEPESAPDWSDPVWNGAPWLESLRNVPGDAAWPRYMTLPHPRAVGSLGPEYEKWHAEAYGQGLRWWQRLVAYRVLEVDAGGTLVWDIWLVSTARQVGKSFQLRGLAHWRMCQSVRFGETQMVMHTGKDLPVCREVQKPARSWARRRGDGWFARESNGRESVEAPDGSQWLVRGQDSVYGYSVSLGLVDEAWDVPPQVVDDGLEPTMPAMSNPQLGLLSTAHRRATSLFPGRRALALAQMLAPADTLILEWSAPAGAADDDRGGWRAASPHWDARRERLLAATLDRARQGGSDDPTEPDPLESFRAQWLNRWPVRSLRSTVRDEPLWPVGVWAGMGDVLASPPGSVVVALDDRSGRGCAAAAAGRTGSGVLVWGRLFPDRARAAAWAELLSPVSVLVGSTLEGDENLTGLPVRRVPATDGAAALTKLREIGSAGALTHDGGRDMSDQMAQCRVGERSSGLVVTSGAPAGLVRCAALAVWAASAAPAPRPGWAIA